MADRRSGEPPDMAEQDDDGDPETKKVSREKTEQESEDKIQVDSNKTGDSLGEGLTKPKTQVNVNELSRFCDAWKSNQSESFFHFTVSIKEKSYNIWEFMESFEFNHKTLSKLLSLWSQIFESFAKPLREQETDVSINKCTNTDLKQMSDFAKRIIKTFVYTNLSCDFRRGLHDLEKFKVNTCLTMEPLLNFGGSKDKEESLLEYANKVFEDYCCEKYDFSLWHLSRFFFFYHCQKINNLGNQKKLVRLLFLGQGGNMQKTINYWSTIQKFSKVQAKTLEEYAQERLSMTEWSVEKWKAMLVIIMMGTKPVYQKKWSALVEICLEFKDVLSLDVPEGIRNVNYTNLCYCYADIVNDLKWIRGMKLKQFNQADQTEKKQYCIDLIYLKIIGIHIFRFGLYFNNANGEFADFANRNECDEECDQVKNDIKDIMDEIRGNLFNVILLRDVLWCIDSTIRNDTAQRNLKMVNYLKTLFVNLPTATFNAIKNHPFLKTTHHQLSWIFELIRNENDYGMADEAVGGSAPQNIFLVKAERESEDTAHVQSDANQRRHLTEDRYGNLVKKSAVDTKELMKLLRAWNDTCSERKDLRVDQPTTFIGRKSYDLWELIETYEFNNEAVIMFLTFCSSVIETLFLSLQPQKNVSSEWSMDSVKFFMKHFKNVDVYCDSQELQDGLDQFKTVAYAIVELLAHKEGSTEEKKQLLNAAEAANKAFEQFSSKEKMDSMYFIRFFLFYRWQNNLGYAREKKLPRLLFCNFAGEKQMTKNYWSHFQSRNQADAVKEYAREQLKTTMYLDEKWKAMLLLIMIESEPVRQEEWSELVEICLKYLETIRLFKSSNNEQVDYEVLCYRYADVVNDFKEIREIKTEKINRLDETVKKQYCVDFIYLKIIEIHIFCFGCYFNNDSGKFSDFCSVKGRNDEWNQIKNDIREIMDEIEGNLNVVPLRWDILKCMDSIFVCDFGQAKLRAFGYLKTLFANLPPETLNAIKNDKILKEKCPSLSRFRVLGWHRDDHGVGDESEKHSDEEETDHGESSGDESDDQSDEEETDHGESSRSESEGESDEEEPLRKNLGGKAKQNDKDPIPEEVSLIKTKKKPEGKRQVWLNSNKGYRLDGSKNWTSDEKSHVNPDVLKEFWTEFNSGKSLDFVYYTVIVGPSHRHYNIWEVMETFKFEDEDVTTLISLWFQIIEKLIQVLTQRKTALRGEKKTLIDGLINNFKKVDVSCDSQLLQCHFEQFRMAAIAVVEPLAYKGKSAKIKEKLLNAANKAYEDFFSEPQSISSTYFFRFFLFYRYQKNNKNDNREVFQSPFLKFNGNKEFPEKYWTRIHWFSSIGDDIIKEYVQEQFDWSCAEDRWRAKLVLIFSFEPVSQEEWSTLLELCVKIMKHIEDGLLYENDVKFEKNRYTKMVNDRQNTVLMIENRISQLDDDRKLKYNIDIIYLKMIEIQMYFTGCCFANANVKFPDYGENSEEWNRVKNNIKVLMNEIIHYLENEQLLRDILKCIDSLIQFDSPERNLGICRQFETIFAQLGQKTLDFIKNDECLKKECSDLRWFCDQYEMCHGQLSGDEFENQFYEDESNHGELPGDEFENQFYEDESNHGQFSGDEFENQLYEDESNHGQLSGDEFENQFYEDESNHGQLSGDESEDQSKEGRNQHDELSGNEFEGQSNGGASENGESPGGEAKDQSTEGRNANSEPSGGEFKGYPGGEGSDHVVRHMKQECIDPEYEYVPGNLLIPDNYQPQNGHSPEREVEVSDDGDKNMQCEQTGLDQSEDLPRPAFVKIKEEPLDYQEEPDQNEHQRGPQQQIGRKNFLEIERRQPVDDYFDGEPVQLHEEHVTDGTTDQRILQTDEDKEQEKWERMNGIECIRNAIQPPSNGNPGTFKTIKAETRDGYENMLNDEQLNMRLQQAVQGEDNPQPLIQNQGDDVGMPNDVQDRIVLPARTFKSRPSSEKFKQGVAIIRQRVGQTKDDKMRQLLEAFIAYFNTELKIVPDLTPINTALQLLSLDEHVIENLQHFIKIMGHHMDYFIQRLQTESARRAARCEASERIENLEKQLIIPKITSEKLEESHRKFVTVFKAVTKSKWNKETASAEQTERRRLGAIQKLKNPPQRRVNDSDMTANKIKTVSILKLTNMLQLLKELDDTTDLHGILYAMPENLPELFKTDEFTICELWEFLAEIIPDIQSFLRDEAESLLEISKRPEQKLASFLIYILFNRLPITEGIWKEFISSYQKLFGTSKSTASACRRQSVFYNFEAVKRIRQNDVHQLEKIVESGRKKFDYTCDHIYMNLISAELSFHAKTQRSLSSVVDALNHVKPDVSFDTLHYIFKSISKIYKAINKYFAGTALTRQIEENIQKIMADLHEETKSEMIENYWKESSAKRKISPYGPALHKIIYPLIRGDERNAPGAGRRGGRRVQVQVQAVNDVDMDDDGDQIQPAVDQNVQMNGIVPMRQENGNSRRRRNIDRDDVTMDSGNDIHQPDKRRRTTAEQATNQPIAARPDIIEDEEME